MKIPLMALTFEKDDSIKKMFESYPFLPRLTRKLISGNPYAVYK